MRHICKIQELEIRVIIKGMPPKEIQQDFMETLGKESPSYSTVKQQAAKFNRGRESVEDDGQSSRPKDSPLKKISWFCTPWLNVIGDETCEAELAKWAYVLVLNDILGMSKISA